MRLLPQVFQAFRQRDIVAKIIFPITAFGQQANILQNAFVPKECHFHFCGDVDFAHHQQFGNFIRDLLNQSGILLNGHIIQFKRLFINDDFAIIGQCHNDTANEGFGIRAADLSGDQPQANRLRCQ